ncbi:Parathyroid Hormone 2 Receptor [Manis pentadactyla]|nr:Parathyroid Hormone 2 Receptor [Manis pentadactyla]
MRIPEVGWGPEAVVPGSRNTAASDPGTDTQVGSAVLGSQAEDRDHWLNVDQSRRTPEIGSRRCSQL